jgi:hypothetical protein
MYSFKASRAQDLLSSKVLKDLSGNILVNQAVTHIFQIADGLILPIQIWKIGSDSDSHRDNQNQE